MNFSIEVPAEANPLTTQTLHHILQSASSNDPQQLKTAAQQLQNWEKSPGFYSSLQTLYIDYSLPVELRHLAILQLKNGIDKYWRKTALNAINKEEKNLIRSRSLESGISEPEYRLALQNSITIAKIVRYEFPHDWPDAMNSVIAKLRSTSQSPDPTQFSRTLLILLHIIKELSTAKLQRSRVSLQSAAPEVVKHLCTLYIDKANTWLSFLKHGGDDEGGALESMDQSLLALRVLRRLIVAGYEFPNRHEDIRSIWGILASHFREMLGLVQEQSVAMHINPRSLIEKHLVQIAKLHLDMVKTHPAGYVLLPDSVGLAAAYWGLARRFGEEMGSRTNESRSVDGEETGSTLEQLSLTGLLLIRACLKMVYNPAQTFKYQQAEDKEEKRTAKELMKTALLSGEFAQELMETLVTRFFVITPQDLYQWDDDPEEWEKSQEDSGDDWELNLRTCSEKLFLDLMINYKELLVQPLINVFLTVADTRNTEVLLKDSIYCAIGLAAPVLDQYPEFDFGNFLDNTLAQEVQMSQPGYNILHRRAAIVLGQWLPVREGLNRPLVYQIFQHLLDGSDRSNDKLVRITSGRQLKNVIDPFEFTAESFMPYASTTLGRLMVLIEEVNLTDTKLALLNTLSAIVTRLEQNITPFADQIISLLPPLWDQAGEEYLLKQSILRILSAVSTSMQAESRRYHPIIIPLIQSSIDPSSETRVYLLEEALDLWAIALTQTPSDGVSPEIITLVQHLFPLFENASENLRKALEIMELYIDLIPNEILTNGPVILSPLAMLLSSVKRDATGLVTALVEDLVRQADNLGGVSAVRELIPVLLSSNWLSTTLSALHDAYSAHQTTGPKRKTSSVDGIVETDYLNVLARIAVASPSLFLSAMEATRYGGQPEGLEPLEHKFNWLLTEWFSHMDNIGHPAHKKLNCLALTALLELGQPWILSRLQSLMSLWTDVINELVIDASLHEGVVDMRDCLVYTDPNAAKPDGPEPPADYRKRIIAFKDPIHRIDIRVFVRDKLAVAIESCGGMEAFQRDWVQNVDEEIVRGFGALGIV